MFVSEAFGPALKVHRLIAGRFFLGGISGTGSSFIRRGCCGGRGRPAREFRRLFIGDYLGFAFTAWRRSFSFLAISANDWE
jgi:hypothetical protein